MALLSLLLEHLPGAARRLVAAHVNYGLRGRDSDRDEGMVRDFCRAQGIPFRKLKVRALAGNRSGLQNRAREVRYGFFARLARREGAWGVAVAHHLEDQAETVLDRLLRGAGSRGLSGLRALQVLRPLGDGRELRVWRPLLDWTRPDLLRHLSSRRVPWRMDRSNSHDAYRRNRIRRHLLPYLSRWNPRIMTSLARIGGILAAEDALLEDLAAGRERDGIVRRERGAQVFMEADFRSVPHALQRRLVRRAAQRLDPEARGLSFERIEGILELWGGRIQGPLDVGYGLQADRKKGRLLLRVARSTR